MYRSDKPKTFSHYFSYVPYLSERLFPKLAIHLFFIPQHNISRVTQVNKLQRTFPEIQRPRITEDEGQINPARV
jgi:hypothetical protein